jgi:hypothetical protein
MAKKNLLSYLNTDEIKTPVLLSQEEINKTYSSGSELLNTDYTKYKNYLEQNSQPVYDSPETWDEKRAKNQSGFDKVLNSTGQMVGTFGTALASTVATLGGAVVGGIGQIDDKISGEDNTDFMDTMINNPIMKGISDFDKYIKEEIVPTYYTKEQQESVFSAATGTDLLNGLGFMASAVLPSQAITKLFGSMGKMVAASKLNKLEPILENAIKFGDITSTEAGMISKTAKYLNQAGPIVGATIGRIGESSMEAYQTYESMLANGATEEEAKQGRNNVFMGNMALAASDLAQYTRWFKGASLGDDLVKQGLSTAVKDKTKGKIIGDLLKEAGQEAAEEGYQFLLSKGAEKATKGKSFIEGISEASGDLFTTTEGLKSMLLGAVLGGGVGGALQARNSKKQKENLSAMANELTVNADTTQRFITDPNTGKQIVNPELTKIATTFAFYENQKEKALAAGDQKSYDIAEKMQFSELVEAKNRAGQFDEFIDQLEEMGRSNPEEVKSMFGNLPIKNGREMTPIQVATEKIQQAKQIKQLAEGLDLLPQLTGISPAARSFIKNKLFAQEVLREEILNIDTKIAEVNSKAVPGIITKDNPNPGFTLQPWDKIELDNLVEQKKDLTDNYIEISKQFKDLIAKPKKAEKEVDNIQNTNIKEAVDNEIEKNNTETVNTTEAIVNNTPLNINGEDVTIIDKDENGNPIAVNTEGEQFITDKQTVSDAVETKKQEEADEVLAHEYDENEEIITIHTGSPKKASTNSTSTKGQEEEFRNKIPEVVDGVTIYKFNEDHIKTVKYLANPENTPSPENPGEYTVRLTLEDEKADIERRREEELKQYENFLIAKTELYEDGNGRKYLVHTLKNGKIRLDSANDEGKRTSTLDTYEGSVILSKLIDRPTKIKDVEVSISKIENKINAKYDAELANLNNQPVTDSEHEVDKHKILYHIFKNGKQVTFDKTHFHEVAYFKKTSTYEKLKAENSEDANKEIERIEAQLIKDRQEIVDILKEGYTVELICKNKSGGIQNFNPQVDGVNQVQPIDKTFGPVDGSKYKTNGIGVITKIENNTTFIKYQYATIPYQGKVNIGVPGQVVFETVDAANQIYITNGITMNRHTPETINSLTELIVYGLTTQNNTIKKDKEEFELINDRKSGLLDGLLYLGNRPSKKESELFIKNNTIRMGKNVVTVTPETNIEELKTQINTFLTAYHAFPAFKPNVLNKKLILPDIIDEDGNVNKEAKIQSFNDFLFKGNRPLIGTNVNSQVPFINSYMNYETNPDGSLMFKTNKEEKPIVKYAEEFNAEDFNNEFSEEVEQRRLENVEEQIKNISRKQEKTVQELECIPESEIEGKSYKASKISDVAVINNSNSPKSFLKNKKKK